MAAGYQTVSLLADSLRQKMCIYIEKGYYVTNKPDLRAAPRPFQMKTERQTYRLIIPNGNKV